MIILIVALIALFAAAPIALIFRLPAELAKIAAREADAY